MQKHEVRGWIEETGVIASVRVSRKEDALFAAKAAVEGGIPVVAIAVTVRQAATVISHLAKSVPGIVVGAGNVTEMEAARQCLDAGAQFLTGDAFDSETIEFGAKQNVVVIPGAMTPSEVISAWETN